MERGQPALVICGPSWLGDTVLSLPAIEALRERLPGCGICVAAPPALADLYRGVRAVDETICFDKRGPRKLPNILRTASRLRDKELDLALLFTRSLAPALACRLARIPRRIGYRCGVRDLLMTEVLARPGAADATHEVEQYRRLAAALGCTNIAAPPRVEPPAAERRWAQAFLQAARPDRGRFLVSVNPGASNGTAKQWPPERYARLCRRLRDMHRCDILLLGDRESAAPAAVIRQALQGRCIDAVGRTSVLQLAALLAACDLLVTNDTGPMHLAGAVGTPLVAIIGPTDPARTGPLGPAADVIRHPVPCGPCQRHTCPEGHHRCMDLVRVAEVEEAAVRRLHNP